MKSIFKVLFFFLLLCGSENLLAQAANPDFSIIVLDNQQQPIANATVELRGAENKVLVKTVTTTISGTAAFFMLKEGKYYAVVSANDYSAKNTAIFQIPSPTKTLTLSLSSETKNLQEVTVTGKKQMIERKQGKTIVNVDAAVTNAGTTVLEVLEKSPGVMVDKNGSISLQGKASVLVMIDDKPTYLSGTELSNLLGSMSSSQVNQIELITSPSAKYDANGNAGIINIKTKKNKQEGFNGNLTTNLGHGRHLKSNNSLMLNYRQGSINAFVNYSMNYNKGFMDIYAYRKYFDQQNAIISTLDQPSHLGNENLNNLIRTGLDFYVSPKTTLGLTLTGTLVSRKGLGNATATWLSPQMVQDSAITTNSSSDFNLKNGSVNLYGRHTITKTQELGFDIDYLRYGVANDQNFQNIRTGAVSYNQGSRGDIPSQLEIFAAKADYTLQLGKSAKFEAGLKSSSINTDNTANYQLFNGTNWTEDLKKSNHFLYREHINSVYSSIEQKVNRLSYQIGLRYENTNYTGNQLGNALQPGSKFARNYQNLFPSGYLTYEVDSANSLSFTTGRRIDRPAYQKLNPFVFIINKYTYQRGNPFFLPQHTWNFELSHSYKRFLTTAISYSGTKNYFSQLFLSEGNDILVYTEGNVGQMHNLGFYVTAQVSPFKWWSVTAQSNFNYKKLSGYQNVDYKSSVRQLHTTVNNQFRINPTLNAEISGFYTTKARNDLQELLYPTGQVSAGIIKTILKGKGSFRLTARDIFYTQAMEGLTDFPGANEYFILWRDTQVLNIGFNYRFGKPLKAAKRSAGGAADEINRAGT
ncbi:outer membrane beta-barrel protein [Pedobacter insulae]|uniref:Outer membrane receptor proteins, mostly Fe transport n=1 Tax=Pedobacter insulae TaxID=414048 RepID=A0A1I2X9D7_9SPHI|nr:outer membrane beta-barrel protein [Pedobacter insulae]SFH09306.1 Outer membrane receptor proteins, mostly Fe transport [Pedobacter insulae]